MTMALLNAGLATLTVGYILGVWTACAIFQAGRNRDRHHASTRQSMQSIQSMPPTSEVMWISEARR
jgi:hypothetical protein